MLKRAEKGLMAALLVMGISLFSSSAFAYLVDGNLADWGVNPFYDWDPSSGTADFVERDWGGDPPYDGYIGHGSKPNGYEDFDVEAMYFDDDSEYFYFAMVSSFPFHNTGVASGDIPIGFGTSGDYEYGIKEEKLTRQISHGKGTR